MEFLMTMNCSQVSQGKSGDNQLLDIRIVCDGEVFTLENVAKGIASILQHSDSEQIRGIL